MHIKYKITIFVFLALVFLYFLHFVITYDRTKETFVEEDDIEHYEEPKVVPSSAKPASTTYDMRIMILDDIEKLNLTDKSLKGKLMQDVFADEAALKALESNTSEDRIAFVKSKLEALKTKDEFVNAGDTSTAANATPASLPIATPPKAPGAPALPESKEVLIRAEEALAHLQKVEANLKQIQTAFGQQQSAEVDSKKNNTGATNIPDSLPPITTAVKSNFTEPSLPQASIEGFENIQNYASIF